MHSFCFRFVFFFQAEDGIRDRNVTGVQTCALPISSPACCSRVARVRAWWWLCCAIRRSPSGPWYTAYIEAMTARSTWAVQILLEIGRASCRERVEMWEDGV